MSKWPMRGHFRHLRFKTFPMTPRTPQCEVFWPLLLNSKHSGVSEDSKSPTLGVLGFTLTLGQNGVATNLEKVHKRYKAFVDKSRWEVNFEEGNEVWLNIKNFKLPKGLNHKFLGPYVGPFKVLEKKFPNTYKLELSENLKVHPIFHVLF